jgi:uncharacterized protein (DUF1697 family)
MGTCIGFLRGINVGGKALVPMAELKTLIGKLGFENVRTLLNSGNVVFDVPAKQKIPSLEALLEEEIARRFKTPVSVMVRTHAELDDIVAKNPFVEEARTDPSHLVVMFFKEPPMRERLVSLVCVVKGREKFSSSVRELYITYPDGIGTSKFTNTLIEKMLNLRGTARNWNTVQKLVTLSSTPP